MDTATIVFAVITLWFLVRGFWLGLPTVLVRLVALIAGYATAIFLAPGWVDWVDANTPLDGLSPYPATLLGAFFGSAFLVNLIGNLIIRFSLPEERRHSGKLPEVLLNGAFGAEISLIAVWCVGLLQTAIHPDRAPTPPSALQGHADKLVASAMAGFVGTVTPEEPQRAVMTQQLMANPAQTVSDLHYMANNAALNSLLRDPDTQRLMKSGDASQLKNSTAFRELARDQRTESILLTSGFLPEGTNSHNYEQALATQFIDIWSRVESVRDNPEFQGILNDPEYREKLQQNDLLSLINDDRSAELAELVWSAQPVDKPSSEQSGTDVHRWQDDSGRWHFSDKPAQ